MLRPYGVLTAKTYMKYLFSAGLFLGLLAVLQWAPLGIPPYILPRPGQVAIAFVDPETRLLFHSGVTALAGVGGFILGVIFGYVVALLFVLVPPLEGAFFPWVIVAQSIPLVALAPLLIFWFGQGSGPRIALAALFAMFPVLVNAVRGLRSYSREHRELLRIYDASPWQVVWLLRIPASLPALFSGMKIAATLAIIGAVTGELAGAGEGLGFAISVAARRLETARSFAAVIATALLGLGVQVGLAVVERQVLNKS
jgi:ABC-type nitrate/sulfonate/bicarbonate transport system permease component